MALNLEDRVRETTTTSNVADIALAGPVTGFQSFAIIGNGNTTYYCIAGQGTNEWEVGVGTYVSSTNTLERTTVLANSAGTEPAKLAFSSGTKDVFVTYPAEKSVNLDGSGNVSPLGTVGSGTWQGSTIAVAYGGTGATTLTGYVKGAGTSPLTASATIPNTDISGLGTMSTQNASSVAITGGTIDGTSIGASSPSTGVFTQVDVDNLRLDANTLSSTNTNGSITIDPNGTGQLIVDATSAVRIAAGTTLERPSGVAGDLRFNSTTNEFEGYNGTAWASVGGSAISNDTATSTDLYPLFANATSGTAANVYTSDAKLLYKPSTGELKAQELVATNGRMSTVKTNAAQIGQSVTPTNNFTLYQPSSPDGTVRLGVGNAGSVTDVLTVNSSGNVGIGNTPAANTRITVRTALTTDAAFAADNTTNTGFKIQFASNLTSIGNDFNNPLAFLTNNTERMRIDSSGNVGIGAASGGQRLYLVGDVNNSATSLSASDIATIQIQNNSTALLNTKSKLVFNIGGIGASSISGYYAAFNGSNDIGTGLIFGTQTNASGGTVERMRIDSSGNLLVGCTDNSRTTSVGVRIGAASTEGNISSTKASSSSADDTLQVYSTGAGAYRFYVRMDGVIAATSTTISAISDQRLKENIQDIDVGLDAVMALKPRKFDWKAGKGKDIKGDRGWIAQEFEQVFPDMIDTWKDEAPEGEEPYKSVRADLIPVLVKAIQEQQAMIQTLQARLDAANL